MAEFVSVVLADTEDTWSALFRQAGAQYEEPKLVLFSGAVQSACGFAQAAVGPFYCPADRKLYIDLAFYRDLRDRFQAPGDFAQAYVIAHEVGHHVQNLLGIADQVRGAQQRVSQQQANDLSVRMELQADCLAGIWAHHANRSRQILEQGDVEEALNAASQIGDDRMQMRARGYVSPESFTHGSAQAARRLVPPRAGERGPRPLQHVPGGATLRRSRDALSFPRRPHRSLSPAGAARPGGPADRRFLITWQDRTVGEHQHPLSAQIEGGVRGEHAGGSGRSSWRSSRSTTCITRARSAGTAAG